MGKMELGLFRDVYQGKYVTILFSIGSKPLEIWSKQLNSGQVRRITDNDINSFALEVTGPNVTSTYITCPPVDSRRTLAVTLPYLMLVVKNLNKYFSFEVQVVDDAGVRRRLRASNFQSTTTVKPFVCMMPMRLEPGWNQIQFNLAEITRRAYGTSYMETQRVQIHANCRLRRVYFADRVYRDDELPPEYRLTTTGLAARAAAKTSAKTSAKTAADTAEQAEKTPKSAQVA